jgi:clan AA aspartic protease (TIGR02281 family)
MAIGVLLGALGHVRVISADSDETLEGVVRSSDGVALEGAVVTLEGIGSLNTNADGMFIFHNVPSGNYRLTVYKGGFPDDKRHILVQAGRANTVRIVLAGRAPAPPPSNRASIPIVQQGSAVLVMGRLNNLVETLFLVDTGATLCVLNKATADRLGLASSPGDPTVVVRTASGSIEAPLIHVDLIQIGEAEARSVGAIVHDVPGLPSTVGAILGLSFLNRFKMEINPGERVMVLSR